MFLRDGEDSRDVRANGSGCVEIGFLDGHRDESVQTNRTCVEVFPKEQILNSRGW